MKFVFLLACASNSVAVAEIKPLVDSTVEGRLTFTEVNDAVKIDGEIIGLKPGSRHGFHVHEVGDCTAPDGSSAKGHYNPEGHQHGGAVDPASHVGDLGNVTADDAGRARVSVLKKNAKVRNGYMARAVIVHEGADDFTTQPSGQSGKPAACGVIRRAK